MQQHKMIVGLSGLLIVILVVANFTLIFPGQVEAKGQCHKINTTITSVANFTDFTTVGEVKSGFLKGTSMFAGDPASLTPITSASSPPLEPNTFSYTGDLTITTKDGTLTTRGVGLFEAVPFGIGTQFDHVIGGTGLFEGASGILLFSFEADETGAAFTSAMTGEICVN